MPPPISTPLRTTAPETGMTEQERTTTIDRLTQFLSDRMEIVHFHGIRNQDKPSLGTEKEIRRLLELEIPQCST